MAEETNPWALILYARAFAARDAALLQVRFWSAVLDEYRRRGLEIKRTDTAGRINKPGGWTLDFGIGEGDRTLHTSFESLMRLPDEELRHWAQFVAQTDLSESFCKMRLHPGSCFDDGDLRDW